MHLTNRNSLKHLGALLALAATFAAVTASPASADLPHTGNLPTWGCYKYDPLMRDARFLPDLTDFVPVSYDQSDSYLKWFQDQPESRGGTSDPTWACFPDLPFRTTGTPDPSGFTPDPTGLVLWYGAQPPIPI